MKQRLNTRTNIVRSLLFPSLVLLLLLGFFTSLTNLKSGQQNAGLRNLEEAVRRSVVACYATEGFYPPDLDYLQSHYGLQIDWDHYTVFYEVFAENLMPDITVLEKVL